MCNDDDGQKGFFLKVPRRAHLCSAMEYNAGRLSQYGGWEVLTCLLPVGGSQGTVTKGSTRKERCERFSALPLCNLAFGVGGVLTCRKITAGLGSGIYCRDIQGVERLILIEVFFCETMFSGCDFKHLL